MWCGYCTTSSSILRGSGAFPVIQNIVDCLQRRWRIPLSSCTYLDRYRATTSQGEIIAVAETTVSRFAHVNLTSCNAFIKSSSIHWKCKCSEIRTSNARHHHLFIYLYLFIFIGQYTLSAHIKSGNDSVMPMFFSRGRFIADDTKKCLFIFDCAVPLYASSSRKRGKWFRWIMLYD